MRSMLSTECHCGWCRGKMKSNANFQQHRVTSPTVQRDGRHVININGYVPYFFASINNSLSSGASQLYRREFGIGIVEWRIISMLAIEDHIPASRIVEVVHLDKSATSRGLRDLEKKGIVCFEATDTDPRRRTWWLSKSGYALHDKVLREALKRESTLLRGIDRADLEIALRVMQKMNANVRDLSCINPSD